VSDRGMRTAGGTVACRAAQRCAFGRASVQVEVGDQLDDQAPVTCGTVVVSIAGAIASSRLKRDAAGPVAPTPATRAEAEVRAAGSHQPAITVRLRLPLTR
jgi:hypothetical protein